MLKRKRGFWMRHTMPFVLVWSISVAAIGFLARIFTSLMFAPLLPTDQRSAISLFLGVILPSLIHVQLVERLLQRSMRGWMLYTLPGALMTLFLVGAARLILLNPGARMDSYLVVSVLAFIVPAPVLQGLWLRKRVQRAWLWPAAAVFTSLAFAAFPSDGSNSHVLWLILTLIYGLIQGAVMHTLWTRPKDSVKAKVDFDIDDQLSLDHERVERLQTAEHLPTPSTAYTHESASARKTQ